MTETWPESRAGQMAAAWAELNFRPTKQVVCGLDFAATDEADDKRADFTAVAICAKGVRRNPETGKWEKKVMVLHVARAQVSDPFRWAAEEIRKEPLSFNSKVIVERRSRSADGKIPLNMMREFLRGWTLNIKGEPPGSGKEYRAQPLIAVAKRGDLVLRPAPWNEALLDELAAWPHGRHDDQLDALAYAVMYLEMERRAVNI